MLPKFGGSICLQCHKTIHLRQAITQLSLYNCKKFNHHLWHSRRKPTFRRQKRKMSFLYQKIALTSFYPMVLVALQYPFVSLSYKRSRPLSYTAEERRNQAKKSRAMFPFTSVKRSRWSDHTHIIPGSRALRWEMS